VPVAVGVMLTEHVAVAPVVLVSDTVAVHDVACPMKTVDGLHATVVVVAWNAPNVKLPLLEAWVASPLYAALTVLVALLLEV
jgi:hypothetical protein